MTKEELEKYTEQYCMDKFGAKTGNKPVKDALIYGYNLAIQINNVTNQKDQPFCKCGSVKNGGYGENRI